MAGTLSIRITTPDAKAMRRYRFMWLVERDGSTLGFGHTNRRDDAETEAWDLVTGLIGPDEIETIEMVGA
ncbi:MAG: hypothetical protein ACYCX3_13970 [Thermoleophilia bacterium]